MSETPQTAFISLTAQIWSDDTGEEPGDRPLSPGDRPADEPLQRGRKMTISDLPHPKPTAQVEPYFEVLGLDDTLRFIEAFGGTEVYIAGNPQSRSSVPYAEFITLL